MSVGTPSQLGIAGKRAGPAPHRPEGVEFTDLLFAGLRELARIGLPLGRRRRRPGRLLLRRASCAQEEEHADEAELEGILHMVSTLLVSRVHFVVRIAGRDPTSNRQRPTVHPASRSQGYIHS